MIHSDNEFVNLRSVIETLCYMVDDDSDGVEEVMQLPTIEIVRCKECKHWYRAIDESGTIERFNFSECTKGHYGNGLEFYCADGERSEP